MIRVECISLKIGNIKITYLFSGHCEGANSYGMRVFKGGMEHD